MLFELIFLAVITWIAYCGVLEGTYVSDDIEGLMRYDGKPKDRSYGAMIKFITFKLFGRDMHSHHFFSITLHMANAILMYLFLRSLPIPAPIPFWTSIIFAIHPTTVQSVGWVSGRGYPISMFLVLLGFNLATIMPFTQNQIHLGLFTIGYGILYFFSVHALFSALSTFVIQAFLGNYYLAFVGVIVTAGMSAGIIKEVVGLRSKVFAEQNLQSSTYLKWQKVIVAFKSLGYYTLLCFFPKRMGLYHTYNYHYSEKTEKEDKIFWFGLILAIGMVLGFMYGPFVVKFAILWYVAYLFIFLNWITIHQFVSERYCYIALMGVCLIFAYVCAILPSSIGVPIFWLAAGLYLMRTWAHIPTFYDEVSFYQSNIWNFPESEVAFGNLGVVYVHCGLIGSAIDVWLISTKINPEYDVAWYNLGSVFRQKGDLVKAHEFLKKAVNSKLCHFKEVWGKELEDLEHELQFLQEFNTLKQKLSTVKADEAVKLNQQLDELIKLQQTAEEQRKQKLTIIQREENELRSQLLNTEKTKKTLEQPVDLKLLIQSRDNNFMQIREQAMRFMNVQSADGLQPERPAGNVNAG